MFIQKANSIITNYTVGDYSSQKRNTRNKPMSYQQTQTHDMLNDYFSNLADFMSISKNILQAENKVDFLNWITKAEKIDKRTLFLFLKKHKEQINPEFLEIAQLRFKQTI